jgi:hypothetical protein
MTRQFNAANSACEVAGGTINVPLGTYNIYGVLSFPSVEGENCSYQVTGIINGANQNVVYSGWSFNGLGGGNTIIGYSTAPIATWEPMEYGANPSPFWYVLGSQVKVTNFYGGVVNGKYALGYSVSGVHFDNDQVEMNGTGPSTTPGYGAIIAFKDSCCKNYVLGGTYIGNNEQGPDGIDDPISFEGWEAYPINGTAASNIDIVKDVTTEFGGVSFRGETSSGQMEGAEIENLLGEGGVTPIADIDSLNISVINFNFVLAVTSDEEPTDEPLINITGQFNLIQNIKIDTSIAGADSYSSYVGSSILGVYGGNPCITGLTIVGGSAGNGPLYGGTAVDCGTLASLGTQGVLSNQFYASSNAALTNGQQGGSFKVGLEPPQGCTLTQTTGGFLANGTYTYIFTALNGFTSTGYNPIAEESSWSLPVTIVVSGGGGTAAVSGSCTASPGAASYKMYGRTALNAPDSFTGYVAGTGFPIVDSGAALTAGTLPSQSNNWGMAWSTFFPANGDSYILQGTLHVTNLNVSGTCTGGCGSGISDTKQTQSGLAATSTGKQQVTILTPGSNGVYLVDVTIANTTAGVSCSTNSVAEPVITWTSSLSNVIQAPVGSFIGGATLGGETTLHWYVDAKSGVAIQAGIDITQADSGCGTNSVWSTIMTAVGPL